MSQILEKTLKQAQTAAHTLAISPLKKRNHFLKLVSGTLRKNQNSVLRANRQDIAALGEGHPLADRLLLDARRILGMARDVRAIASQPDPLYNVLEQKILANGLRLKKQSVPLGVISVIYESRPNVTVDSACLAIKSGNAILLKGGSESEKSNLALVSLLKHCLIKAGLPSGAVSYVRQGRRGMAKIIASPEYVDVIIPRGGARLIDFVRKHSEVPVIETGAGVCHTYIDGSANVAQAVCIAHNAKTSRPTVCNALDTLLIHRAKAKPVLEQLAPLLAKSKVTVYADRESMRHLQKSGYLFAHPAQNKHFGKEFLSMAMAVKIVPSLQTALDHISRYGSRHSEAIVSTNKKHIDTFLNEVDAACVYANASTRFTDGSQFGLGGEIGISTQKLHARGPLGLTELTSYKWIITGTGQIRT